jgi:cytosine/adenosine deaminase-related metal-dependent hydrolase
MPEASATPWTVSASWIFPVSAPPLPGGVLTIAGERILTVEAGNGRRSDVDLGDVAILPGLVNAHTHLDLTGLRGQCPPRDDFTGWLRQVIAHRRSLAPEQVEAAIRDGLAESLRHGTTLVGDISGDGGSWDVLAGAPLRAVVFREMLGLPPTRASGAWERFDRWLQGHPATATCRPGVSPHAPYSVRAPLFFAASTSGVPVAVHLAETRAEQELLILRRGPFVQFLQELGVWDPDGLAEDIQHVLQLLSGAHPTLIVHGNYLPPDTVLPPNASLVYCPRTHAAFGHSAHPFAALLARGIRVALGTDSLASNPDLSILEELRFLHRHYPEIPGDVLLRMATLAGAEALGWAEETGSLETGKSADLVAVPLDTGANRDPYERVLAFDQPVSRVLCRGRWIA